MAASETAKLVAELSLKDKLSGGVKTALSSVSKLDKGLGRSAKGAGQLASGMARAGTIIAGAAVTGLGAAAKAAIDWEDAFAGVVKTVDEADLSKAGLTFRDLELSLRKMSTTMPVTAADLARIAESGGAMGIAGKDIEEFTRVVAVLGATTNITVDDAAVALGQMTNVIGLTADEFDNFAAALVDLGNKGNSTEAQILEIARRSGGAAKLIGIAKEATLGWAAAAANLGLNEELAGTAVQNFFLKTQTAITAGGADLRKLAKISGVSTKQFKKNFDKDASGALEDFLKGLSGMTKDARLKAIQDIFGKGSGLTRLIVGLSDSIDTNLTPSLDTSTESWKENTAAQIEFDKRNATVRSGITRFKNSITDAAITLGEGFAPALGRAAGKLADFLAQDVNRSQLKKLGEDIGKAIDKIDWGQVLAGARTFVDVMKTSLSYAKQLLDAVMKLPDEIKVAGLAFVGLNKLSGGGVGAGLGNIVGGLGEAFTKQFLARGSSPANPVWVAGTGVGGPGGVPGAGGGGLKGLLKATIVGAVLVEGFSEWAKSIQGFVEENNRLGAKGMTAGEIEAQKYYTADAQTQDLIFKRLGRIPTQDQWLAGPKILPSDRDLDNSGFRPDKAPPVAFVKPDREDAQKNAAKIAAASDRTTTAVETAKGAITTRSATDAAIIKASVARSGLEAKSGGIQAALAAKNAGNVARSGGIAAARAIDRKDLSLSVAVSTTNRFSIREQANAVSSRSTHKIL